VSQPTGSESIGNLAGCETFEIGAFQLLYLTHANHYDHRSVIAAICYAPVPNDVRWLL